MFRHLMLPLLSVLALAATSAMASPAHTLTNGRVTVVLKDPAVNAVENQDRVDSISWINSSGVSTGNLAHEGGSFCGDDIEYWGEAYGRSYDSQLFLIIGGTQSKWKPGAGALSGVSATTGVNACATEPGRAKTHYSLSVVASRFNALRVQRKFMFNAGAATINDDLRGYVPRMPKSAYQTVLVPDASGNIQSFNVFCCGDNPMRVASWNGTWFADDDGAGDGLVVIRDASSTAPGYVLIDNDDYSDSNNTSITLVKPANGWTTPVTETEWLCFYDAISWPTANRAAGLLPTGCKVKTVASR